MKKRILALFLGGVVAAGSLAMQMPVTAWAITKSECEFYSEPHIKSYAVTAGDGQLTVTVNMEYENQYSSGVSIYLLEKELVKERISEYYETMAYPVFEEYCNEGHQFDLNEFILFGGTHTFTGLTNGKTYYVYAEVSDWHDMEAGEDDAIHYAMYLGSIKATAGATLVPPASEPIPEASTVAVPTPETSAVTTVPTPTPEPTPVPETSIVTVPTIVPNTTVTTDADSIKAVAAEVLKGKWGVGKERKIKLEAAGYDYDTVQKTVAQIMK